MYDDRGRPELRLLSPREVDRGLARMRVALEAGRPDAPAALAAFDAELLTLFHDPQPDLVRDPARHDVCAGHLRKIQALLGPGSHRRRRLIESALRRYEFVMVLGPDRRPAFWRWCVEVPRSAPYAWLHAALPDPATFAPSTPAPVFLVGDPEPVPGRALDAHELEAALAALRGTVVHGLTDPRAAVEALPAAMLRVLGHPRPAGRADGVRWTAALAEIRALLELWIDQLPVLVIEPRWPQTAEFLYAQHAAIGRALAGP
ncbi:hypothetical protein [Dactylosporangium sp. NPDC051541]|uniref:hypothetical protein n=1 Tax=Dactylosporangium sp. NPDC051541 TaxID=3363977 RepID=UPI0037B178F2